MERIDNSHRFEDIYETILGLRTYEGRPPFVQNIFEEGSPCDKKYEEMRQAYARVCQRLGKGDEDEDLEIMVNSLEFIQKEVCKELYKLSIDLAEMAVNIAYSDEYIFRKLAASAIRQNNVDKLKEERKTGFIKE